MHLWKRFFYLQLVVIESIISSAKALQKYSCIGFYGVLRENMNWCQERQNPVGHEQDYSIPCWSDLRMDKRKGNSGDLMGR
mmetsp:Transcript_30409/g.44167  ORF Transcript_30409/g.44167 Transcript_30409/m.44167 type:complete len:81 (-) Transcript_30409:810-1052(-)